MNSLLIRELGLQPYEGVFSAMQSFTHERGDNDRDEIWSLQHLPVYTQGRAGKAEFLINPGGIPVIQIDRGGQVTYHGPGQLVMYLMLNIKRLNLGVRSLVTVIEDSLIEILAGMGITATADPTAPGVYVDGAKIAALGLRISRGCSYHGLSLNLNMDMEPWRGINPCGLGVQVVQVRDLLSRSATPAINDVGQSLVEAMVSRLGYASIEKTQELPPQL